MTYLPGFENPIGYVVGVRQWQYDGFLRSVTADYTWEPWKVVEGDIDKPAMYLGVFQGIYAAKEEYEDILNTPGVVITGKVALWGRVAEHTKGYRAQYAYPISLDHCTDRHVDMDQLREIYLNPPTETTKAIVEERLAWISEKKREKEKYSQSVFHQGLPPSQVLQNQWSAIHQGRQAGKSQAYHRAMDALWQQQMDRIKQRMLALNTQPPPIWISKADDGITWKIDDDS